jgi:hypothetical protein
VVLLSFLFCDFYQFLLITEKKIIFAYIILFKWLRNKYFIWNDLNWKNCYRKILWYAHVSGLSIFANTLKVQGCDLGPGQESGVAVYLKFDIDCKWAWKFYLCYLGNIKISN